MENNTIVLFVNIKNGEYEEGCNEGGEYSDHDGDYDGDGGDIYIMMKCLSVCVSRKMITSSWESPVTT